MSNIFNKFSSPRSASTGGAVRQPARAQNSNNRNAVAMPETTCGGVRQNARAQNGPGQTGNGTRARGLGGTVASVFNITRQINNPIARNHQDNSGYDTATPIEASSEAADSRGWYCVDNMTNEEFNTKINENLSSGGLGGRNFNRVKKRFLAFVKKQHYLPAECLELACIFGSFYASTKSKKAFVNRFAQNQDFNRLKDEFSGKTEGDIQRGLERLFSGKTDGYDDFSLAIRMIVQQEQSDIPVAVTLGY